MALFDTETETAEDSYTPPAFSLVSSAHTALNYGTTAKDESSFLGSVFDVATKGVAGTVVAAYNELSNIPATLGNWITRSNDYEITTTKQRLADLDSDLEQYYNDHQLGIDTAGFIVGSMVPGMAGVKVLRAGQVALRTAVGEGAMGSMTSNALGLVAPSREKYLSAAIKELTSSGNVYKLTDANVSKALIAGAWQNVLEGAIFTGVVNATMHQSPILDERSTSDLMWDVVTGGVLGGVIGGAIAGVGANAAIRRGLNAADQEIAPWTIAGLAGGEAPEALSASDKILRRLQQLDAMPAIEPTHPLAQRIGKTAQKTTEAVRTEIRELFGTLTHDDQVLANKFFANSEGLPFEKNLQNLLEAQAIVRVTTTSGAEKKMNAALKAVKDPLTATREALDEAAKYRVSFLDLRDPNGAVLTERPALLNLGDKYKEIKLAPGGKGLVLDGKIVGQENNPHRAFNIFGLDHSKIEQRYAWSELLPKWVDDGSHLVHANDIPLLQKAVRDGITKLKVIPESGMIDEARLLSSADDILAFTRGRQKDIAERLAKRETVAQDVDTLVDKLRHAFGINFNVVDDAAGGYYGFFHRILGKGGMQGKDLGADIIALEKTGILSRPLSEVIRTLKHEEGHAIFQSILESKGINRANLDTVYSSLKAEVVKMSQTVRPGLWKATDKKSIDYRNNWHELFADSFGYLSRNPDKLKSFPEFNAFAGHLVRPIPQEILDSVARRATKASKDEIAKIVNAHKDLLDGVVTGKDDLWNMREYLKTSTGNAAINFEPQYAKIITTSERMRNVDGNLLQGMEIVASKEAIYKSNAARVVTDNLGIESQLYPDSTGMRGKPIGTQTGSGFITSEGGNYGTWSSFAAYIGQRTHNVKKAFRERTAEIFNPILNKMAVQTQDALEFSMLNEQMRNLPNKYFLGDDGISLVYGKAPIADNFPTEDAFLKAMEKHSAKLEEARQAGLPLRIEIKSPLVRELVAEHVALNNTRKLGLQKIHANNGYQDRFEEGLFYPIPRNPKDTPHFAFVIDKSVNGTGHSKMIYAKDADTLETMRNEILGDASLRDRGITVLTKAESEKYFKSVGQYEFERTLHENYINTALARSGKGASFLPVTDPKKIVTDFLEWHHGRDDAFVRTNVEHMYAQDFARFRAASEGAVEAAKSKAGYVSNLAHAESAVDNPASNLMKMMLDISKVDEYPLWTPLNKFLDGAFSKVTTDLGKMFSKAKSQDELDGIYSMLKENGYTGPVITPALYDAMNGKVPRGLLSTVVNKANALIATFALRADPFNALNNAVGSSVLLGTEAKAVIRAIEKGNAEAVGELAKLAKIVTPGTGDAVLSPTKIIAKHVAGFHKDIAGRDWARRHGFISSISDQYDQTLDHIGIALANGDSTFLQSAMDKAKTLGDAAEKWTGNKLAEEMNRYVAAMTMKDITDIAVKHKLMTPQSALSYINTFVNRTQGNYLASQRPILFQGPLGQAIGLFQTYQFNMLQQVFRHIGDGNGRNVLTMMGLQTGIYGMNGLPAFNAINTYIVGQAGGNLEHKNLYDAIFSGAGKEAGEWLLYGGLSNGLGLFHPDLKTNIYSRGDINPRHITLVPTDPASVPIVQATARLFGNLKEGYQKVAMGADVWSTFLRGVEQNGISRPLAGLAQVLEGVGRDDKKVISMNQQGNMLMAHDFWSLSSLMRVAGAKPLDEAIVNDTMFRINTYRTADAAKRKVLGEAVKLSILGGNVPDEEQVNEFAEAYARTGGKQSEFARWMANQYTNASSSQAEQLRQKVGNPQSIALQTVMDNGGE